MLVEGGVVDSGREDGNARLALAAGRSERGKALAKQIGIVLHRPHAVLVEEFRKHLHHGFPVFQHVADAGRRAGIVLQHIVLVFAGAYDVGTDDVGVDAARRPEADHLRQEGVVLLDQFARDAPGADDLLLVVDVVEKGVERDDALFDALGEPAPFAPGDDAGYEIEGDQFFGGIRVSVDCEGDARLTKNLFGFLRFRDEPVSVLTGIPLMISRIWLARAAVRIDHFVKCQRLVPLFSTI